jgi:hypothetical protein
MHGRACRRLGTVFCNLLIRQELTIIKKNTRPGGLQNFYASIRSRELRSGSRGWRDPLLTEKLLQSLHRLTLVCLSKDRDRVSEFRA